MKRWAIIAVVLSLSAMVPAQNSHWEIGLNGCYAMPNNFNMMEYAQGAVGLDVAWMHRSMGNEYWQLYRHYPTFGLRGSFLYLPGAVYGHRFGIIGLVKAPLGKRIDYSIGAGLSFFTKPQSLTGDTTNIFISSVVSCLIDVGFDFRLDEQTILTASLLHSSNGMLLFPNKGLNFLQMGVRVKLGNGYERTLDWQHARELITNDQPATLREWNVALALGTVMSRDPDFKGYYPCYDLAVYYQHYLTPVFAVGGAVDLWYNFCDARHLDREDGVYTMPLYLSAMGMMEFFWGPLSIKAGIGPTIVGSPQVTIPVYERVGAYYNFGRNYLGVALNAHVGRIEFIEWTYGLRFPVR